MRGRERRLVAMLAASLSVATILTPLAGPASAWSNGGYSADPANPDYGTHDWIAEHALSLLPPAEKQYILDAKTSYIYATELPDNGFASDGIGDNVHHHAYYWANGTLQEDDAAARAREEFLLTRAYIQDGNLSAAAKRAGILSHYIADLGVFGHVMGAGTDWGTEVHHSDYETYIDNAMPGYTSSEFDSYLKYDGALTNTSAYDVTIALARDTTFGVNGTGSASWMDANYNWSSPAFKDRAGDSLNKAVNAVADVLHALAWGAGIVTLPRAAVALRNVTVSPDTSPEGSSVTVTATLSNTGTDGAGSGSVEVRYGGSRLAQANVTALPAGSNRTETLSFVPAVPAGRPVLLSVVAAFSGDTSTGDDIVQVPLLVEAAATPQTLLAAANLQPSSVLPGSLVNVTWTVVNTGDGPDPGIGVAIEGPSGPTQNRSRDLAPGGVWTDQVSWVAPVAPGTVSITLTLRRGGTVLNRSVMALEVGQVQDLVIGSIVLSPAVVPARETPGDRSNVSVSVDVTNIGLSDQNVSITVLVGGAPVVTRQVRLAPGLNTTLLSTAEVATAEDLTMVPVRVEARPDPAGPGAAEAQAAIVVEGDRDVPLIDVLEVWVEPIYPRWSDWVQATAFLANRSDEPLEEAIVEFSIRSEPDGTPTSVVYVNGSMEAGNPLATGAWLSPPFDDPATDLLSWFVVAGPVDGSGRSASVHFDVQPEPRAQAQKITLKLELAPPRILERASGGEFDVLVVANLSFSSPAAVNLLGVRVKGEVRPANSSSGGFLLLGSGYVDVNLDSLLLPDARVPLLFRLKPGAYQVNVSAWCEPGYNADCGPEGADGGNAEAQARFVVPGEMPPLGNTPAAIPVAVLMTVAFVSAILLAVGLLLLHRARRPRV